MPTNASASIADCVETICGEGCKFVNHLLLAEDPRLQAPCLRQLNQPQIKKVMKELQELMAVYADSGNCKI